MMRSSTSGSGRRWWAIAFMAAVATGAAWSVTFGEPAARTKQVAEATSPPFTIGAETTVLEGPLTDSGLVDYLQAHNEQGMAGFTPEENAAVIYLKAFGPSDLPYEYRDRYFEALGIDPLPNDGEYLERFSDFMLREGEGDKWKQDEINQQYYRAISMPWQADDCPDIARWMKENEPYFDLAMKAIECRHYFMPVIRTRDAEDNILKRGGDPLSGSLEELVAYMQMRSLMLLGQDDLTGAFDQLVAIRRLGRQQGQTEWSSAASMAQQCQAQAMRTEERLIRHRDYSAKYSRLFISSLSELEQLRPLAEMYDQAERWATLDQVQQLSVGNLHFLRDYGYSRYNGRRVNLCMELAMEQEVDWDQVLRTVNEWFDRLVASAEHTDWEMRRDALLEFQEAFSEFVAEYPALEVEEIDPTQYSQFIAAHLLELRLQQMNLRYELSMMLETKLSLRMASLAVEAYQRENQAYPRELSDLVPEYLGEIPRDPFSDGEVVYQRRGRQFLLYSVGENGVDNEGENDYREKDDITLRY